MTFFKKMLLVITSCCLAMCSCGKTDTESDAPDGIVNIEVVTEPLTESMDDEADDDEIIVTTTAPVFIPEYVWTTTTIKKAKPYHAAANNNYTPKRTTTSPEKPSKKTTTTAKRVPVPSKTTIIRPGSGTQIILTSTKVGTGTGVGTLITTTAAITTAKSTTTAAATTTKPPQLVLLEGMTLEEKVCQMFVVSPEQLTGSSDYSTDADKELKNSLKKYPVGGLIFSKGNIESKNQITAMLRNLQTAAQENSGAGIFTVIQEEGGTFAPVSDKLGIYNPGSMAQIGEKNDKDAAYNAGKDLGSDLNNLGFNINLAPVADLGTNSKNGLGSRVFSSNANIAADMVSKLVEGLSEAGVGSVLCHFPGVGAYDGKSALIKRSLSQLRKEEFLPFKSGIEAGADFVLVSHHIVSGIGDNLPCSLSYTAVTGILRNELEFDGIIITESHKASAITKKYSAGEAAVMAINAGADIVLHPADLEEAVEAVCAAVESGEIMEKRIDESVARILAEKAEMGLI
ncbi:MAG: glycoside hydrolase family 3 [Ruminococcus sp.]|nr:glycoside hydrolase family 3 [Ruminococcus sp.]